MYQLFFHEESIYTDGRTTRNQYAPATSSNNKNFALYEELEMGSKGVLRCVTIAESIPLNKLSFHMRKMPSKGFYKHRIMRKSPFFLHLMHQCSTEVLRSASLIPNCHCFSATLPDGPGRSTHARPVLVKNTDIFTDINKWIFFLKKFTLLERLPQCRHFWLNPVHVRMMYIGCGEF